MVRWFELVFVDDSIEEKELIYGSFSFEVEFKLVIVFGVYVWILDVMFRS